MSACCLRRGLRLRHESASCFGQYQNRRPVAARQSHKAAHFLNTARRNWKRECRHGDYYLFLIATGAALHPGEWYLSYGGRKVIPRAKQEARRKTSGASLGPSQRTE